MLRLFSFVHVGPIITHCTVGQIFSLIEIYVCSLFQAEKDSMTRETVNKLSQLIRDKDLEIQSLVAKNDSLVRLVKTSGDGNKMIHSAEGDDGEDVVLEDSNKRAEEAVASADGLKKETQTLKVRMFFSITYSAQFKNRYMFHTIM